MKIVWSALAKEYYFFIIEQIFEKWNTEIVETYENETISLIEKIQIHNHICPKSKIINLHKCVSRYFWETVY